MPVQNFEPLDNNTDVTTTRTLLHEVIPLTGAILASTYGTFPNEGNIKTIPMVCFNLFMTTHT